MTKLEKLEKELEDKTGKIDIDHIPSSKIRKVNKEEFFKLSKRLREMLENENGCKLPA